MQTKRWLRVVLLGALLAGALTVGLLWWPAAQGGQAGVTAELAAPPFLGIASAEDAAVTGVIQDEAGIAAWFDAGTAVDLNLVRGSYRVIETETADYILGSVAVPDYTEEWHDVHLYVHRDGWFLAYYLAGDSTAKIIDWVHLTNAIPTKFERILALVSANAALPPPANVTYYDFRFPNATRLMIAFEDYNNGRTFSVRLPSSFIFYSRSWSVDDNGSSNGYEQDQVLFYLDGKLIGFCRDPGCMAWGDITPADLAVDSEHWFEVNNRSNGNDRGGIALTYRETP